MLNKSFIYKVKHISLDAKMAKRKLRAKSTDDEFIQSLKETQKDPQFMKDIDKFIEATTKKVFKLKDLGF